MLAAARGVAITRGVAAPAPPVLLRVQRLVRLRRGGIPREWGALEVFLVVSAELRLA